MLRSITIAPKQHTATIIFLHGLGDSGHGWEPVGEMLKHEFPQVKWIFPHAPSIPITLNGGMRMPGWYDIYDLSDRQQEDEQGLLNTQQAIQRLLHEESKLVPPSRIILGGFSQGAATTLLASLTHDTKLGGFIGLSGYLPLASKASELDNKINHETPYFLGHGTHDPVVSFQWGQKSKEKLETLGKKLEFHAYPGMQHSTCPQEFQDLSAFISRILQ
ncbi:putative acyl-protein thioesterase-1 [Gorgonomyces haynaldii]|nr:putative acyl-protein thioesterase-1 [Gorgonomyces haynaldii]